MLPGQILHETRKWRTAAPVYAEVSNASFGPTKVEHREEVKKLSCDPLTAGMLAVSAVGTGFSIYQGAKQDQRNQQIQQTADKNAEKEAEYAELEGKRRQQAIDQAERMMNGVNKITYDIEAHKNIAAAAKAVTERTAALGIARSTAADTAAASVAAGISQDWAKQYMGDKRQAENAYLSVLSGQGPNPYTNIGAATYAQYNPNPYGGVGQNLAGGLGAIQYMAGMRSNERIAEIQYGKKTTPSATGGVTNPPARSAPVYNPPSKGGPRMGTVSS